MLSPQVSSRVLGKPLVVTLVAPDLAHHPQTFSWTPGQPNQVSSPDSDWITSPRTLLGCFASQPPNILDSNDCGNMDWGPHRTKGAPQRLKSYPSESSGHPLGRLRKPNCNLLMDYEVEEFGCIAHTRYLPFSLKRDLPKWGHYSKHEKQEIHIQKVLFFA